ncbi:hypothetical protein LH935_06975 [Gordonia polyisoprenivorans]|uniref:hypothetical protein n=1 Tax=Gordonia polyisoprenivorans TaxID=84595 RepID=UPI0022345CC5|nr:hypothetical protein LH935_06975 [Gordonia polyisoprenivorans]
MTLVVKALGTGERPGQNMLSLIPGQELVYRNEIAPIGTQSYAASVLACRAALRAVDARGEPWAGVGYSLGAAGLGDYVMLDHPQHCVGIVQLADPLRARGQCSNPVPKDRWGVAGERTISGVPVYSFAIPDDPITSCPGDNGMRLFANAVTGRQQPVQPRMLWDAGYTIAWLWKYLRAGDSRHIVYGSEKLADGRTYVEAARDVVRELAA